MNEKHRYIDHIIIKDFIRKVLYLRGVDKESSYYVAEGLVHASLRGIDSHGVRLLAHYLQALEAGRINPNPEYRFYKTSSSTGLLDADNAFGHAAGMIAVQKAVEIASETGIAAVGVKRSTHFGAASYFGLEIARKDMIGFCFTHSDSLMVPTGGKRRYLGNNPICFTAPCEGEEPICLDMATSVITFNKILQLREEKKNAPIGVGADRDGNETIDPFQIVNLLPVGGYKGYGLSLMVETLCAMLTGMPFGPHIPRMYDAPIDQKRNLGHFFIVINIRTFIQINEFKKRLKQMAQELRNEPNFDPEVSVLVAGDPEKRHETIRKKNGIPLRKADRVFFKTIAEDYNLKLNNI